MPTSISAYRHRNSFGIRFSLSVKDTYLRQPPSHAAFFAETYSVGNHTGVAVLQEGAHVYNVRWEQLLE